MDMDEITLVLMEMDTILRLHIGRDIAPRRLFHIDISTEVPLFPLDIYREVRMVVHLIWTWDQYICDTNREQDDEDEGKNFEKWFHCDLLREDRMMRFDR